MLPLAIAGSAAIILIALQRGWLSMAHRRPIVDLRKVALLRLGVGSIVAALLYIAYPLPPVSNNNWLLAAWGGLTAMAWLLTWLVAERADNLANGPRVGAPMMAEIMYDVEEDDDAESADDWVVQPVATELHDDGGREDRASAVRIQYEDSAGGRSNQASGAVVGNAAHPRNHRGGRGRRLSNSVLPRQGAHHPSAGAGEYDAAAATIAASIA
jgi:hypothetical protein